MRRSTNVRPTQNYLVVWLDEHVDEVNNREWVNIIDKLKEAVHTVRVFSNVDKCIDFIAQISKEEVFFITSNIFGLRVISMVHKMPQVSSIYLFGESHAYHKRWAKDWSKIDGVFTDVTLLRDALKKTVQACEQNSISISFVQPMKETSNQNLDEVDRSFWFTQVLKEILLSIEFDQHNINKFVEYCYAQFVNNPEGLANVNRLEQEYHACNPIWWYTYRFFLQSMLNRAFRSMEVDLITNMGFFVRDLHWHISTLHTEQSTKYGYFTPHIVYRAQGLSKTDFNQLTKTKGGFLSFNNFLLTTKQRQVSLDFARDTMETSNLIGILFAIKIDSARSWTPFADIRDVSYLQGSEKVLFSIQSVFRIGEIKQLGISYRLWEVSLTPASDEDPQLLELTECIRKETFSHLKGWYRLGNLLLELGAFDKAEYVFESMLKQSTDECEKGNIYHKLGEVKDKQEKYAEAIEFLEKSIGIHDQLLSPTHSDLNNSIIRRGTMYPNRKQHLRTLQRYRKGLAIRQKTLPPNHVLEGLSYNNIGQLYYDVGEYSEALSYHNKALEIFKTFLPPKHPHLATAHHNNGVVHYSMGEYAEALSSYEKALEIRQKILPPDDPDLAISYASCGSACHIMGEYSKAISSYEKAIEISRKILPPYHAGLIAAYNDIMTSYSKVGKYSKAFSACGRALEICQSTNPKNNSDLATCYNNIGGVYIQMGEYSKALYYFEKARKIFEQTLSSDHPDLATSYSNVGGAHFEMKNFPQALSFYEKALEIRKNSLPSNHPDVARSYNNLGGVYFEIRNYLKAHQYFKFALEFGKRSLPSKHPDLCNYRHWIEVTEAYL